MYLIMGLVCGLLAFGYEKVLLVVGEYYQKLGKILHINPIYFSIVPLVAIMPPTFFLPILSGGGPEVTIPLPKLPLAFWGLLGWVGVAFGYCRCSVGRGGVSFTKL
ncbi:ClC family H(+)/Cl(-) exchange transporter, partial [Streptococcus thoraltensis]